jgi:hypothetical protein
MWIAACPSGCFRLREEVSRLFRYRSTALGRWCAHKALGGRGVYTAPSNSS